MVLCAFAIASTWLFHRMFISADRNFPSDMRVHIEEPLGLKPGVSYSLLKYITIFLYKILADELAWAMAVIVADHEILTLYAVNKLFVFVGEYSCKTREARDFIFYRWLAILYVFIVSSRVPMLLSNFFTGNLVMTCCQT